MTAPALTPEAPAAGAAAPMSLRRYATLVGWGLLVTTLGQMYGNGSVGYLPLRLVLKDQVHVTPTEMATFFFWAILPWSFKPLAGLITGPRTPGLDEKIDIARIEGQVKVNSVRKVAEFVESHPEESVSILRSWLHETG